MDTIHKLNTINTTTTTIKGESIVNIINRFALSEKFNFQVDNHIISKNILGNYDNETKTNLTYFLRDFDTTKYNLWFLIYSTNGGFGYELEANSNIIIKEDILSPNSLYGVKVAKEGITTINNISLKLFTDLTDIYSNCYISLLILPNEYDTLEKINEKIPYINKIQNITPININSYELFSTDLTGEEEGAIYDEITITPNNEFGQKYTQRLCKLFFTKANIRNVISTQTGAGWYKHKFILNNYPALKNGGKVISNVYPSGDFISGKYGLYIENNELILSSPGNISLSHIQQHIGDTEGLIIIYEIEEPIIEDNLVEFGGYKLISLANGDIVKTSDYDVKEDLTDTNFIKYINTKSGANIEINKNMIVSIKNY